MKPFTRVCIVALAAALASGVVWAQGRGGGAEWPTTYGDAQRTSWIRADAAVSVDSMSKPGFELQWKTKLENQPRQLNSLSQGIAVNGVTLFTPLSTVTGSSNNVFAIDNDTGNTFWMRHFDAPVPASATAGCPGGMTAAPTRMVNLAPAALPTGGRAGGGGGGRGGSGYSSSVSQPGEGVPMPAPRGNGPGGRGAGGRGEAGAPGAANAPSPAGAPGGAGAGVSVPPGGAAQGAAAAGAPGGPGAPGAGAPGAAGQGGRGGAGGPGGGGGGAPAAPALPGAPPGAGGGGFGRPSGVVYVLASDGVLHTLGFPSGKDVQKPASFLPANARASDLIAVQDSLYLYTTTSQNCGAVPNGVWAMDMSSEARTVTSWKTNGGSPVGPVALATDGTLLVAIGAGQAGAGGYANAIVALDPKTLQLKDWFTDPMAEFVSAPLVFRQNEKDIVAAATRDGRILLLDAGLLGGANHSTPLYASRSFASNQPTFAPEALAMWQEVIPIPGAQANPPAAAPAGAGAPGAPAGGPAAPPAPTMQPGTRWLLVPVAGPLPADAQLPLTNGPITNGAILALKVVDEEGGKPSLQPGWVSRDLVSPVTPIVVTGVVFAASTGKPQATTGVAAAPRGTPAALYAFNGATGKELWNSGKAITSFMSGRSFWSGTGQVYAGTFDGTVYAFGFAMERR